MIPSPAALHQVDSLQEPENAETPASESEVGEIGHAFRLGRHWFLLPPALPAELIPALPTARLPFTRPGFLGLANHRGDLIPIYDLAVWLDGEAATGSGYFLILGQREARAGLRIDRIESRVLPPSLERKPLAVADGGLAELGAFSWTWEARTYIEVDFPRLFAALVGWSR